MESLYEQVKDQVDKMQRTRQGLENDIEDRKNKISLIEKLHSLVNKSARKQNKE